MGPTGDFWIDPIKSRESGCRNSTPAEHHRVLDLMERGTIDVSAWPTDFVRPEAVDEKFPL
jgi:hypothetical protein